MEKKVKKLSSIKTKICFLTAFVVILTGVTLILVYSGNVKKQISAMAKHYSEDMAISYGELLQAKIEEFGTEEALSSTNLTSLLEGIGLEGIESSYTYVVSPDGTMLYHPTAEKIGQPVENEAVKGVVSKLSKGEKVKNGVVSYVFNGVTKYAGIFVNPEESFILIVTADEEEIFKPVSNVNKAGLLGLVFAVIMFSFIGFIIASIIVKPINLITTLTGRISNMDFTENTDSKSLNKRNDETGKMNYAMSVLRSSLAKVVLEIRGQSEQLMESAESLNEGANNTSETMEQVEKAVNDIAIGASSQAEETQRASENVIVMGNMVKDTHNQVAKLITYADAMKESSEYAQNILNGLGEVNQKAEDYVSRIAEQTRHTSEAVQRIGEATGMISEIASQTNLLSLNASIEAARAGEQGRGFAVVASEISQLAEQSNASASEIGNIINELVKNSDDTIKTMNEVREIIMEQSRQMKLTDDAFVKIRGNVEQSVNGMQMISSQTEKLDEARVNVVDVVNNLSAIAQENAAGAEETSASVTQVAEIISNVSEKANELRDIAKGLEDNMGIFRI